MAKNSVINIKIQFLNDIDPFSTTISYLEPTKPLIYAFDLHVPLCDQIPFVHKYLKAPHKVEECALQLYRAHGDNAQCDFGSYLDWDMCLADQPDELAQLKESNKTSLVLRTNICVRVRRIIEKLLNSTGRELRRALFSLKQIFQDDKDLVHEFVQNNGLSCLIKVGTDSDQSYQNYILRALGQIFLYIDGMNGVIAHNDTIQWLYSLLTSQFRLVVKTALKLLLVFVEYTESNALLFLAAVYIVDKDRNVLAWSKVMYLLNDTENSDNDIFIYAMTLINKTLNAVPDQDTYYDLVDSLEEQGMPEVLKRMLKTNNRDLCEQIHLYESMLQREDDPENYQSSGRSSKSSQRRRRYSDQNQKQENYGSLKKPHSTSSNPKKFDNLNNNNVKNANSNSTLPSNKTRKLSLQANMNEKNGDPKNLHNNNEAKNEQKLEEDSKTGHNLLPNGSSAPKLKSYDLKSRDTKYESDKYNNNLVTPSQSNCQKSSTNEKTLKTDNQNQLTDENLGDPAGQKSGTPNSGSPTFTSLPVQEQEPSKLATTVFTPVRVTSTQIGAVHSLAEKFCPNKNQPISNGLNAQDEPPPENTFAAALIKARNSKLNKTSSPSSTGGPQLGLVGPGSPGISGDQSRDPSNDLFLNRPESDVQWEMAAKTLNRPLKINDLDFCELNELDDTDPLQTPVNKGTAVTPTAPPPLAAAPLFQNGFARSPSTSSLAAAPSIPPPLPCAPGPAPPAPSGGTPSNNDSSNQKDNMKTVKLFWKEAQINANLNNNMNLITNNNNYNGRPLGAAGDSVGGSKAIGNGEPDSAYKPRNQPIKTASGVFWQKIPPVQIDTDRLIHLFETKPNKEVVAKKKDDRKTEIRILDFKRSNAINIGLTKLPNPRAIITSILKFDSAILNKESIEKLLTTMVPTDEETKKIRQAQSETPDLPLGSAEHFLLMLSEIPALKPRLNLWLFMLDYANLEREVAEPLMDLKTAIQDLERNRTFQYIMATLLAIGNALNGVEAKGFQLDFLAKVHEVKDTINKNSLIYHLCSIVTEKFPDSTDLYSDLGSIIRCSKVDFDQELSDNLQKLEKDCKSSWDHLRILMAAKNDNSTNFAKIGDFLTDCAHRIMTLKIVHRRVINRFRKFLLYMGSPSHVVKETKINSICKIIAEFSLEYRTCREKMLQQKKRIQEKRERNKTRGKLIIETKREWSSVVQQQQGPRDQNHMTYYPKCVSRSPDCHGNTNGASENNSAGYHGNRQSELNDILTNSNRSDNVNNSFPGARLRVRKSSDDLSTFPARRSDSTMSLMAPGTSQNCRATGLVNHPDDDEILDGLVKAATVHTDHSHVRERRRARLINRKSLRRTRTLKANDEDLETALQQKNT